jgi:hypothetical protein
LCSDASEAQRVRRRRVNQSFALSIRCLAERHRALFLFITSLTVAGIYITLVCVFFQPMWETNDDVAMSMVAHGYGTAAYGSPNLVFSNVLWGYLVQSIPAPYGILGYSIATISVLGVVAAVVFFCVRRQGSGFLASALVVALVLARPALFPQFTINAGLLSVAGVLCWMLYERRGHWQALFGGVLLAWMGSLVRIEAFALVMIVALPFLPWRSLRHTRHAQIAAVLLFALTAASAVVDEQAYEDDDWQVFNALDTPRAFFTDFGVDAYLKDRADILSRHDFSPNDVDLIRNWFFADPKLADPQKLRIMIEELGDLPFRHASVEKAWLGVRSLWHPNLMPLVLAALVVGALRPTWQLVASWILCLGILFAIGLLGRPGVLRIYVPVVVLLLLAPLVGGYLTGWRRRMAAISLVAASAIAIPQVVDQSREFQAHSLQVRSDLFSFPDDPVVAWGSAFPYEAVYPVLEAYAPAMKYRIYSLGTDTWAPYSLSYAEHGAKRGMIDRLISDAGVPIIAYDYYFELLEGYCREHHQGVLQEVAAQAYGSIAISWRRCDDRSDSAAGT